MMDQPAVCRWHRHKQPNFFVLIPGELNHDRALNELTEAGFAQRRIRRFLYEIQPLRRRVKTAPTAKFTRQHRNNPSKCAGARFQLRVTNTFSSVFPSVTSSSLDGETSATRRLFSLFHRVGNPDSGIWDSSLFLSTPPLR